MLNYQFWGQLGLFKLSRAGQMHLGGFLGTLFSLKTQPRAVWIWEALVHLQPPDTDDPQRFLCLIHPPTPKYHGSKALRYWLLQHSRFMALHKVKKLPYTELFIKPLTGSFNKWQTLSACTRSLHAGKAAAGDQNILPEHHSRLLSPSLPFPDASAQEAKTKRGETLRSPGAADGDGREGRTGAARPPGEPSAGLREGRGGTERGKEPGRDSEGFGVEPSSPQARE